MQDLIEKLKNNAGLTQEQALKSVEIMKEYIHAKVPPMFSGVVDKFFAKNPTSRPEDDPLG